MWAALAIHVAAHLATGFNAGPNAGLTAPATNPPVDFEREIAPLFAAKCLPCHGPEKQRSGYRLKIV
jgi:hypothetical protein